jgi:hypothetical protein
MVEEHEDYMQDIEVEANTTDHLVQLQFKVVALKE